MQQQNTFPWKGVAGGGGRHDSTGVPQTINFTWKAN